MNGFLDNLLSYCRAIVNGVQQLSHFRLSYFRKVFSLMGKREKIVVIILTVLALGNLGLSVNNFYVNHTAPAPTVGGIYTEGMVGQPTYLNPLLAHTEVDQSLNTLIFSALYKYDNQGKLIPDLADGMPIISTDQKQYTINLKKNIKWHNDRPFTADDVVFTIQTIKDINFKSPQHAPWTAVDVRKLSDSQIQFTTKDVTGTFIHQLTLGILPRAVWGTVSAQNFVLSEANLQAVGTGPYAVQEIKKLKSGKVEQVTLNSYSNYYGGKAKIDTLIFKFYDTDDDLINALHSKEISGLGFNSLEKTLYLDKDRGQVQITQVALPQYQVIFFNLNNKILADQNVRAALNLATDKQEVINSVFKGTVLLPTSPFKFGQTATGTNPFNFEQAKNTLDAAGWKIDPKTNIRSKKNVPLQLTIATNDFLVNSKAAETVSNQWKKLNIGVTLTVLPTQQLTDTLIRPRTFDVLLFQQKFDADPDPFVFWHSSQAKDPGFNLTGFNDSQADKLITQSRTTTDQTVRMQQYQQIDATLQAKTPAIFLDQSEYIYAVDQNVKNIGLHTLYESNDRFYDLPNWYINQKRVWK